MNLIFMAWSLAVFCETFKCLIDEGHISFIDVEAKKSEATCCAATDAIEELKCLTDKVVVGLVVLRPQIILSQQFKI